MNDEWSQVAANAVSHWAEMSFHVINDAAQSIAAAGGPSAIFRPRIFIDGNQWCALYGENLQDGVAGFGDSPELAMHDFDVNWSAVLTKNRLVGSGSAVHSTLCPTITRREATND